MNKGLRFFFSLLLVAALVCGALGCFAEEAQEWTAGSIVTFGRYPQTVVGEVITPIEWIVLEVDEENHRALLISRYGLDVKPYHTESADVTWETCSLRAWLNDQFMCTAFSPAERSMLLLTDVDNSDAQGCSEWKTTGGNDTQDYIFLLSYAEAKRYFNVELYSVSGSDRNMASRVSPTAYAIQRGACTSSSDKTADGSDAGSWWLRSPGNNQYSAAHVTFDGSLIVYYVYFVTVCVRPALWIDLESEIF